MAAAAEKEATKELILGLKRVAAQTGDESDSSESSIVHPSNRGRKLKRKSRFVHEGQLDLPTGPKTYREEIGVGNQKRYIIQRKKRKQTPDSDDDEDWESSESEPDPYEEIDISKILAPLSNPADLPTHPGLSHPYKSNVLERLIQESQEVLFSQHNHTYHIKNLLTTFLGDDDFISLDKMVVDFERPPSDLGERIAEETGRIFNGWRPLRSVSPPQQENGVGVGLGIINGSLSDGNVDRDGDRHMGTPRPNDNDTPPNNQDTGSSSLPSPPHRMSTRSTNAAPTTPQTALDPFFVPPYHSVDRTFGIPPTEAEETLRLLLAASQRQDEVLRGLAQIRELLLKANRMKREVWGWSRSMEGYRNHAIAKGAPVYADEDEWGELTDGEDYFDQDEWGVDEPLAKGVEEEAEEEVAGKKTRGRRNN